MNCQVLGRIRFPKEVQLNLDPRLPAAFKLRPVGLVQKSDARSFLRFSHKVGRGGMKVYSQVLFDLYLTKTNFKYPSHGALPPNISDLKVMPFATEDGLPTDPTEVVKFTKNSLRGNPREDRTVYVNKPHNGGKNEQGLSDTLGKFFRPGFGCRPRMGSEPFLLRSP